MTSCGEGWLVKHSGLDKDGFAVSGPAVCEEQAEEQGVNTWPGQRSEELPRTGCGWVAARWDARAAVSWGGRQRPACGPGTASTRLRIVGRTACHPELGI